MFGLRTEWLVHYQFQGGKGRVFITTKHLFRTRKLIEDIEDWITKDRPELSNVAVYSAQFLGFSRKGTEQ